MGTKTLVSLNRRLIDKKALQRVTDELNNKIGLIRDPHVTPAQVRALMIADGVRPDDCSFSREIVRLRDGIEE
jgi:hypothetical protein